MMYWHKVKMVCKGHFVASSVELSRPVSEAESKNAYARHIFCL